MIDEKSRKVVLEVERIEGSSGWHDDNTHKWEHAIYVRNLGAKATREVH